MRHIISVLLENEAGALSRVSGLFSSRGFNIESLTVAVTNNDGLSRMTIVSYGDDRQIEQIIKQLNKLIDVFKVIYLTDKKHIDRELMLIKLSIKEEEKLKIKNLIDNFSCKVINALNNNYIIEISGHSKKLNDFLEQISFATVIDISRTGISAILDIKK